jgi:hypothetical protein
MEWNRSLQKLLPCPSSFPSVTIHLFEKIALKNGISCVNYQLQNVRVSELITSLLQGMLEKVNNLSSSAVR